MKIRLVLVLLALFGGAFVLFKVVPADGAPLTTARIYMNRQIANQATGQQFEVFFTPTTNVSGGAGANEIRIIFPDGDDGEWCRSAGSLTVTDVTNPEGATESATNLPGTQAGTCAQGSGTGSAESNADRFLITSVDNLTGGTKYGFKIVANTAALGTATPAANNIKVEVRTRDNSTQIDASTIALSLVSNDQITVTAVVDATLTVTLDTNTAALGTLSTATVSKAGIVSQVSTSAANGYISLVKYDQTLTSGVNTIGGVSGGTIAAGESEYGAASSDSGNTIGQWSPANCTPGASTSNATTLTTSFQSFASNTVAATNESTTLCFLTSASAVQAPGTYTSTATLVTTALF